MSATVSTPQSPSDVDEDFVSARPEGYLADHQLDRLEYWLDERFRLPIIGSRIGADGIVGLVPVVGDVFTTGLSAIFIADAMKMGARKTVIARMVGNVAVDFILGAIPLVGDLFDFFFKSNRANLKLLREEKQRLAASAKSRTLSPRS